MSIVTRELQNGERRYDVRIRLHGKTVTKTFRVKRDAQQWEREQLRARDRGEMFDPNAAKISLGEWVEKWQATTVNLRPSTQRVYDDALRLHVLPKLGGVPLANLTPSMLRDWLADLSVKPSRGGTLSPSTVKQAYATLKLVLNAAVAGEVLARNPLSAVKSPKVERRPQRYLTAAQVRKLADVIDPRYRVWVFLGAYCGLRAGEVRALRTDRIDLEKRSISIVEQLDDLPGGGWETKPPKSAAGVRSVPIPGYVADEIAAHIEQWCDPEEPGFLLTSPEGGPVDLANFRARVWKPALADVGLEGLRIHDLRHTCASLAIAADADVKSLQLMLGHTSAAMTLDRYGHLMPGRTEAVADRLDAVAREAAEG